MKPLLRAALWAFLVLVCLGMAALQLWRADVKGQRFAAEQAALISAPIALGPAHRNAAELIGRAVTVRGQWLDNATVFLDNKTDQGRVGYHVLTPLRLDGSDVVVLVNRGWIRAPQLRSDLPTPPPAAPGDVVGIARGFETRAFELGEDAPAGRVWQHVREATYRRESGFDVLPIIVLQTDNPGDGLVREWRDATKPNPANAHYGYAVMWLVFALIAVGYGFLLRRPARVADAGV